MRNESLNNISLILEFQFQQPKCFFSNYFQLCLAVLMSCLDGKKSFLKTKAFFRGENTENRDWDLSHLNQHVLIIFSLRLRALMNAATPVFKWNALCKFGSKQMILVQWKVLGFLRLSAFQNCK